MIEETLSYRLLMAMKATRPSIWPVLADLGLYPGQDLLLSELWREDGITQGELVARLGVEAPTVSKALQRLERAGYVRRESGRGRTRLVFLTDEGRRVREHVERAWRQADEDVAGRLSRDDRARLADLLERLTEG